MTVCQVKLATHTWAPSEEMPLGKLSPALRERVDGHPHIHRIWEVRSVIVGDHGASVCPTTRADWQNPWRDRSP